MTSDQPLISIYLQVYNTKDSDLRQCIDSVLGQTYTNFEFIILDNGSTDGSAKILRQYGQQDKRIKLTRVEKNVFTWRFPEVESQAVGEYFAYLDSDDWWDSRYLESLLTFAQENHLDIAGTGCVFHVMTNGTETYRTLPHALILNHAQFGSAYPQYHAFFRTFWGRLTRMEILKKFPDWPDISYGLDTVGSFCTLRLAKRMGIQNSTLYHYRIHGNSISYQYNPKRFDSDVYLYNDAVDFLKPYGPISKQNQIFLYAVYANAIRDTMGVIHNSTLTPEEKIHEYAVIAAHQTTQMAYRCQEAACRKSRNILLNLVCSEGLKLKQENEDLRRAMQALLPQCGLAVSVANLPLLLAKELQPYFLADNRDAVVKTLLKMLPKIKKPQQYDLGVTIQRLAIDHRLLFWIDDLDFLTMYTKLYSLLWDHENEEALDQMTGLLIENQVEQKCEEVFLKLYIDLAAQEGQESAFVFGKIKMAAFYGQCRRFEEARRVLDELEEMGLGELEEVQMLRSNIEQQIQQ